MKKKYLPNDIVKTCKKLEAGLRFGQEGIAACALGPFQSPIYWTPEEIKNITFSKEIIVKRREEIFHMLNHPERETPCKTCQMVYEKPYKEVDFTKLGHIDFSAASFCNIRCHYCWYTKSDTFVKAKYDSLDVLKHFTPEDVLWDSAVDFGGGEPTLLENFDECIKYFESRNIRTFLYSNSVKFSQAAYDAIKNGTINWLCTSLDCGTPSSYKKMKGRDHFEDVMNTLFKYKEASKKGKGNLSVKYIFTDRNCGEDDISGFTYAMKALEPDKIWLTFDFEPLKGLSQDSDDFGDFNYQMLIDAYVKLYIMLRHYDLDVGHFLENHLSQVNRQGNVLLKMVLDGIKKEGERLGINFINDESELPENISKFKLNPLKKKNKDTYEQWDLSNKKIILAPTSPLSERISQILKKNNLKVEGFLDKNPVLEGKSISGTPVYHYDNIKDLDIDTILILSPFKHESSIVNLLLEKDINLEKMSLFRDEEFC